MPKKRKERPFTLIANWKMNKTIVQAKQYVEKLPELCSDIKSAIWLSVPFTSIQPVRACLPEQFHVGAQNMNDASSGAFTGEVAAEMITDAGGDFVLLGHSERRFYFHESDEFINKKVLRALESSLSPVLCIGETFEEREGGKTKEVLTRQLSIGLNSVRKKDIHRCLIAYEPVWAIGTGKSATSEIVLDTHGMVRSAVAALYDEESAKIPVLYGGSVSVSSAEELSKIEGVDGFLVGTASLDVETFAKIAQLSQNSTE
jgi:triosephosphate isomerase